MYRFFVQLFDPYTMLVLGLLAATGLGCRRRPRSRGVVIAAVLVGILFVLSTPLVGFLLLGSLEWPYPPLDETPSATDTIVVLSGGVTINDDEGNRAQLDSTSLQRCQYALHLYRKSGRCRMLLTGGKVDWTTPGPTYAA